MLNQPRHYSAKGETPVSRRTPLSYENAYGVLEQYRRLDGSIRTMGIPDPERIEILLKLQRDVQQAIRDSCYG